MGKEKVCASLDILAVLVRFSDMNIHVHHSFLVSNHVVADRGRLSHHRWWSAELYMIRVGTALSGPMFFVLLCWQHVLLMDRRVLMLQSWAE